MFRTCGQSGASRVSCRGSGTGVARVSALPRSSEVFPTSHRCHGRRDKAAMRQSPEVFVTQPVRQLVDEPPFVDWRCLVKEVVRHEAPGVSCR